MLPLLHLLLIAIALTKTIPTLSTVPGVSAASCRHDPLNQLDNVVRDAFLLTEGESLKLSCGVCGVCLRASDPPCSNRVFQVWMTPDDIKKRQIRERTKIKRPGPKKPTVKKKGFRAFLKRMKELMKRAKAKATRAKKRIQKVFLTMKHYASIAVQRFDQLKRLSSESDNAVGFVQELTKSGRSDARLQWFVQSAQGKTSRIKHEALGVNLLFDLIVLRRATAANTGLYTCMWDGRVRAVFGVTVVDGGVEPYREFKRGSGQSLQPRIMPKANLQIYTRWMNETRYILLPHSARSNNASQRGREASVPLANNISMTWGVCYVKQLDPDKPVIPESNPYLKLMPHGLPCRSHLLPVSVKSLRSIIHRPSETQKLSTIKAVAGAQLHFGLASVNYSTTSPPPLHAEASVISRSFMVAKQNEFVSLECPLKQTLRGLIAWFKLPNGTNSSEQIKTEDIMAGLLNPYDIRNYTRNRIFTDPGGNLNMANVENNEDEGKYFCLHNGRLVGYVYLIVYSAKEQTQILYYGGIIVNVLRVLTPLIISGSIVFLTLVVSSGMFEPEVPW